MDTSDCVTHLLNMGAPACDQLVVLVLADRLMSSPTFQVQETAPAAVDEPPAAARPVAAPAHQVAMDAAGATAVHRPLLRPYGMGSTGLLYG
jgi:hypothetical protein